MLLLAAMLTVRAEAKMPDVSAGGDWITGNGYRAWNGNGRLDFGDRPDWSLNGSFGWAHSHAGTESVSKQASIGFEHNPDDNWSFRGSVTGWREYITNVRYAGPSWGVTYVINEKPAHRENYAPPDPNASDAKDEEEPETPAEFMGFSFDNDLYFYHMPQNTSSNIAVINGRRSIVPPLASSINMTQWHPTFTVEKPLFSEALTPSLEIGHYFYSVSPSVILARAGNIRFSSSAGSLNGLAGGLFKNDATAALEVALPLHCRLHGSLAGAQSATDNSWAITQELSVRTTIADHVSLKGKWDHTIQAAQGTDQYTVGLTLLF